MASETSSPNNRFGLTSSERYQLRDGRDDRYSYGMLLVWALRRMKITMWPDYLRYIREKTECSDSQLQAFVLWVDRRVPWVAAHERIDPSAIMQIFKECELDLALLANVSYNLYTDPRKGTVTDRERCIRNHKLLRQLDRARNLGGRSVEELLDQEVPVDEDRAMLHEVLIEVGPGSNGRIDRKTFRSVLARREYNPNKRFPAFRRLVAPVFAQAAPEPVQLAQVVDGDLVLDPIVVAVWRAVQKAVQLLHAHHRWPIRRIVPARVVQSIAKLCVGANGEATSVLTSSKFFEEAGRCSGGRLYRLASRVPRFVCEGTVEDIDTEAIWTAVVTTYKNDLLYRLPTELSKRLSGRHLMSARELESFQENLMPRASKNSADVEAVRQILVQLVGVMQSQFGWPGKDILPAELINAVLQDSRVQGKASMQELDSARVIRVAGSLNKRFGFIWHITPDAPEELGGESTIDEFAEHDFLALVRGTLTDGQLRAMRDQARRKLKEEFLLPEEEPPAVPDKPAEGEPDSALPKQPSVRMGLLTSLLARFYDLLCERREWPHEGVLTVVMVRSVAELVYPKMQTDLEFVERVFLALPEYGVIGERAKIDIDGTATDVYTLLKTSIDGMEGIATANIDDSDLINIIDELLPQVTKDESNPKAITALEVPWSPPEFTGEKRNIGTVVARDAHAWEAMLLILEVMQQEFDWPFTVLVSKGRNIALAHCNPRSSVKALSPIGSRMKEVGLIENLFKVKRYNLWRVPLDVAFRESSGSYREGGVMTRTRAREAIREAFSKRLYTIADHIREIRDALTPEELATIEITVEESAQAVPEEPVESQAVEEIDPEPEPVSEPVSEPEQIEEASEEEVEVKAPESSDEPESVDEEVAADASVDEPEVDHGTEPPASEESESLEPVEDSDAQDEELEPESEVSEESNPEPEPVEDASTPDEEPGPVPDIDSEAQALEPEPESVAELVNEPEQPEPVVPVEAPTLRELPAPVPQEAPQAPTPVRTLVSEAQTDIQKLFESTDPKVLASIFGPLLLDPLIRAQIDARLAQAERTAQEAEDELAAAEEAVERARERVKVARQGADAAKLLRDALRGELPEVKKATA